MVFVQNNLEKRTYTYFRSTFNLKTTYILSKHLPDTVVQMGVDSFGGYSLLFFQFSTLSPKILVFSTICLFQFSLKFVDKTNLLARCVLGKSRSTAESAHFVPMQVLSKPFSRADKCLHDLLGQNIPKT